MANPEIKELENVLNSILEKKKEEGISWVYVNELIKEARAKLGYPDDDFPKWKWHDINRELAFQITDREKIDLSDFSLEELK